MTPAYLAEVERAFVAHSGRGLMLSPADRDRVAEWARAGIPVAVVVDGIARAFEGSTARRVRGLGYAAPAVDEAIAAWKAARVGRDREQTDEAHDLAAAFDTLIGRVETVGRATTDPAIRDQIRQVWRALDTLRTRWRGGEVKDPIGAVLDTEKQLLDRALAATPDAERAEIEADVAETMESFSIHDPLTRQITHQTLTHEAIRTRLGLPPLELRV